ncbi:MAG: uracil-DNA glycosylase, partial [Chloroflexi bacterium]|nr:uracil-DNA glycosylase [Chloroflexota bacterium]
MSALSEIREQILRCQRCSLYSQPEHRCYVPGEGPEDARIMFIGEAPGQRENETGSPFVGPAGKFLEELLASAGMRREDVFITNIIKCKPPQNRDPFPIEIEACRHWIDSQLEIMKPRIVVTLGRYSMAKFFPKDTISKVHGQARRR